MIIDDKEELLKRVKKEGISLKYASTRLKKDPDIVLKALKQNACAMKHASSQFKRDKQLALSLLERNSACFMYLSPELRSDFDVIKATKLTLFYIDKIHKSFFTRLKKDRDFLILVLKEMGDGYQYTSLEFQDDEEITFLALKKNISFIKYTSKRILKEKSIVYKFLYYYPQIFLFFHSDMKSDKDIVFKVLESSPSMYLRLGDIGNERDVVIHAIKQCQFHDIIFKYNSFNIRWPKMYDNDTEICMLQNKFMFNVKKERIEIFENIQFSFVNWYEELEKKYKKDVSLLKDKLEKSMNEIAIRDEEIKKLQEIVQDLKNKLG